MCATRTASGGVGIRTWSSVLIVGQVAVALVLLTALVAMLDLKAVGEALKARGLKPETAGLP